MDGARIEALAEAADRLGNDHAVDAVLQVGVVAAHVQAAVGVLHHAWRLQQHLVDRRGRAQRQRGDGLPVDHILAAAGVRRQRVARAIQRGGDRHRAQIAHLVALPVAAGAGRRIGWLCGGRRRGGGQLDRGRGANGQRRDGRQAEDQQTGLHQGLRLGMRETQCYNIAVAAGWAGSHGFGLHQRAGEREGRSRRER